jgi:hypothetical protein
VSTLIIFAALSTLKHPRVGIIGFIRIALVYKSVIGKNIQVLEAHLYSSQLTANIDNLHPLGLWVAIQSLISVFCCCVPTYRPFIKQLKLPKSVTSRYASFLERQRGSSKSKSSKPSQLSHSYRKPDSSKDDRFDMSNLGQEDRVLTRVEAGSVKDTNGSYPLEAINVHSTVEMV